MEKNGGLLFFSIPKPFEGHIGRIQTNAIQSWKASGSAARVILFGDDQGVAEAARRFGALHIPEVKKNDHGTPLVSDVFEKAAKEAGSSLLCYINTDIIVLDNLAHTAAAITLPRFLLVGRRWDLDFEEDVDFKDTEWAAKVRRTADARAVLHSNTGIDYFIFTPGLYGTIPPFAVGRTAWDNWLIYKARRERAPVINGTEMIRIIHQNHGYPARLHKNGVWQGEEACRNLALAGDLDCCFTIKDADWNLSPEGLVRGDRSRGVLRKIWNYPALHSGPGAVGSVMKGILTLRRAARLTIRRMRKNPV